MPYVNEENRRQLNAWLARFAPLVMNSGFDEVLDEQKIGHRLKVIQALRQEVDELKGINQEIAKPDDQELIDTFRKAASQLDSIEEDLRAQLAQFSPGNPEGLVDLDLLQTRLAEREAKQEIGVPTASAIPETLSMQTQSPNMAAAGGLGCMAVGVTSFTVFHAFLMIGGMFKAFGVLAFGLVLFYGIFWFFCFKMFQAAKKAASQEKIEMNGNVLRVVQTFMGKRSDEVYKIDLTVPCLVARSQTFTGSQRDASPTMAVVLTDVEGNPVEIAHNAPEPLKQKIVDRLNAYMSVQRNQVV